VALAAARSGEDRRILSAWARTAPDARVRIASLRRLVELAGSETRDLLLSVVDDAAEKQKVRAEAARLLGSTGEDALSLVRGILASERPERVRAGAAAGLVSFGPTAGAAVEIARVLSGPSRRLHTAVVRSLAEAGTDGADRFACDLVVGTAISPEQRARIVASLGARRVPRAGAPLARIVAAEGEPVALRRAAAVALAGLGRPEALPALEAALATAPPDLRPDLSLAAQRIRRQLSSRR
jgi:HEAT repeat protein